MLPKIGILLGDGTGIGPEIVAKLFIDDGLSEYCRPIIIGDIRMMDQGKKIAHVEFPVTRISRPSDAEWKEGTPLIDLKNLNPSDITPGEISPEAGRAAGEMLVHAMKLCRSGDIAGFSFAPYNKAAMEYGGFPLMEKGTSIFARHLNWKKSFGEMNVVNNIWTSRVTSHIPLKQVSEHLTTRRIAASIRLAHATLKQAGFDAPRLAVTGLNPHNGENGLCGTEEIDIIHPAVEETKREGITVSGPFSADTLFVNAVRGQFDGIITMYHDQGQIALKLLDFDSAVTVLAGLPYPITTPSHGTAFDIVGKGLANSNAMKLSVIIASKMADRM